MLRKLLARRHQRGLGNPVAEPPAQPEAATLRPIVARMGCMHVLRSAETCRSGNMQSGPGPAAPAAADLYPPGHACRGTCMKSCLPRHMHEELLAVAAPAAAHA
jgi:hypothetical protein